MFRRSYKYDDIPAVVYRFLSYYSVKVRSTTVRSFLLSNHDYPSLKSVCDLFKYLNVTFYPIKVTDNDLFKIGKPFISHLKHGSGRIVLVYNIANDYIHYSYTGKDKKKIETQRFLNEWSNIAILIEPGRASGEKSFAIKRNEEILNSIILPFLCCIVCILGIVKFLNFKDLQEQQGILIYSLLFTKLSGFVLSILLFLREFKIDTVIANKLCNLTTSLNCDAVTESKGSKIFGILSWAELGIVYFSGGLILSLFILHHDEILTILFILSCMAILYPAYSILYQWLKIKIWCPLCLLVQIILISEFVLFITCIPVLSIQPSSFLSTIFVFSIIFIITIISKNILITNEKEKKYYLIMMRFKRDPGMFISKLNTMKKIELPHSKYPLVSGNDDGCLTITVFLGYYCSFCAKKYSIIQSLIENDTKMKIILAFAPQNDEVSVNITKLICFYWINKEKEKIIELLGRWYSTGYDSIRSNIEGYDMSDMDDYYYNYVRFNRELFSRNKISTVPAVYLNGFTLPDLYDLNDIDIISDDLIDIFVKYEQTLS